MRLLIILLLSPIFLFSQIVFEEHILAETQQQPYYTYTSDLDGDGDLDLLSNGSSGNTVWFENTDGFGEFSDAITIANFVGNISTSDIDGDGDLDVIIGTVWFENLDGAGTFGTSNIIHTGWWNSPTTFAADLDNDGDIDIIAAYYWNTFLPEYIVLHANDGFGNFSDGIIISSELWNLDVLTVDIDSDGDLDLFTASYFTPEGVTPSHSVGWYENTDGLGAFSAKNEFSTGSERIGDVIRSIDMDGDGDLDILTGGEGILGDKVIWFENLDGEGTFSPEQIIAEDVEKLDMNGIHMNDVDDDGDMDVIASWNDGDGYGEIVWYENTDDRGNFGYKQIVTSDCEQCGSIYSGDFDGDSDIDVFAGSLDKFTWYENSLILGNVSFDTSIFSIYPNPAKDQFLISLNKSIELEQINIYNYLAQLISSTQETTVSTLGLSIGMYYVEVISNQGKATKKLIIE